MMAGAMRITLLNLDHHVVITVVIVVVVGRRRVVVVVVGLKVPCHVQGQRAAITFTEETIIASNHSSAMLDQHTTSARGQSKASQKPRER
jgi:ABC-type long-subunit fatty acid transport system fused permease/ATPase subunit